MPGQFSRRTLLRLVGSLLNSKDKMAGCAWCCTPEQLHPCLKSAGIRTLPILAFGPSPKGKQTFYFWLRRRFSQCDVQNQGWPTLDTAEAERDEWDIARDVSERRNRDSLFALPRSSGDKLIEVYGIWLDDHEELAKPPVAFEDISLDGIWASDFRCEERIFYRVSVTACLSITTSSGP
jgi:hypothetical protein